MSNRVIKISEPAYKKLRDLSTISGRNIKELATKLIEDKVEEVAQLVEKKVQSELKELTDRLEELRKELEKQRKREMELNRQEQERKGKGKGKEFLYDLVVILLVAFGLKLLGDLVAGKLEDKGKGSEARDESSRR